MNLLRFLRQSVSRIAARPSAVGLTVGGAALFAAGTFCSVLVAAPTDTCLPALGCVTTSVPTVTVPTVTLPTVATSTTTATTTTTGGGPTSGGSSSQGSGSPTSTGTTTTTATHGTGTPTAALSVRITVRVLGHGPRRAIELRLRLNKPARVNSLLSRSGKTLGRKQFNARSGGSVWRLRLARTVKAGRAKLGLTYRSSSGEIARSSHTLRLPL
jgi:hypothetical protein